VKGGEAKGPDGRLLPGIRKIQERTRNWYGEYKDADGVLRRVPLCSDRDAARAMLNELVTAVARRKAGLLDPFEESRKKPLAEHIAVYRQHLKGKGNDPEYVEQAVHRLELIAAGCGFKRLSDIQAAPVVDWLRTIKDSGRSHATINLYTTAIKGFCRWAVKERRMPDNPLGHLSKLNEETDVRLERRNLSPEEFNLLLQATQESAVTFRKLSGPDRAMLYTVAAYTGLRASELGSLTRTSLTLEGDPPTLTVQSRLLETTAKGRAARAQVVGGAAGDVVGRTRPRGAEKGRQAHCTAGASRSCPWSANHAGRKAVAWNVAGSGRRNAARRSGVGPGKVDQGGPDGGGAGQAGSKCVSA